MRKITELNEIRYKTIREKDVTGKRIPRQVSYTAYKNINVVSGGKRFAHHFVDGIVYYVIYYFFEYLWFTISKQDSITNLLTGFSISLFFMFAFPIYYILFEHFFQRTPGKFLTKCLVIDIYGNKPKIENNILRNIIRLVPFEGFSCLFNERGWHDRWSDTFVVRDDEYLKIKELLNKEQLESNHTDDVKQNNDPVNKKTKSIFIYIVLPLSFLLYVTIIYKGCSETKELINNPQLIKEMQKRNTNK